MTIIINSQMDRSHLSHIVIEVQQAQELARIQLLLVGLLHVHLHIRVGNRLLGLVVQVEAVPDPLVQGQLRLVRHVDVPVPLDPQDLALVVDLSVEDAVSQGLGHHKLNVFCVDVQLFADVLKRNLGVGKVDLSQTDSDNDLIQPQNERVESVLLEDASVGLHHFLEISQRSL